jgi:hypothetical protein
MESPTLALTQIFTGASASLSNRWSFCSFLDNAVFAQSSIAPQYWPGSGTTLPLPGLDPSTRWDGVLSYEGHLMGFQGATLTWSDVNDFTNFIPVGATIQDVALTLANNFTQLPAGTETDWIFVNQTTAGMVADMFVRIDYPPYYNFYTVNAVSLTNGSTGTSCDFSQTIPAGSQAMLYTSTPSPTTWASTTTTPGVVPPYTGDDIGFLQLTGSNQPLKIVGQSNNNSLSGVLTTAFTAPTIGSAVSVNVVELPGWQVGDYLSLGGDGSNDATSLGLDIYQVASVTPASVTVNTISGSVTNATSTLTSPTVTVATPTLPPTLALGYTMLGQTIVAFGGRANHWTITLSGNAGSAITNGTIDYSYTTDTLVSPSISLVRMGIGTNQQTSYPGGAFAVTQPYILLENDGLYDASFPPDSSISEAYALKLTLNSLTGTAPAGSNFVSGTQILSLNANEAGQLVNAGDRINGPIWAMSTSGLYAVIMKERSFQSIQYVGLPNIFNIWPEFTDEGLLGKNTWCKVGENTIYFWGHRAFFQFASGGGDATPIGQKQFVEVLKEIDLERVSEACMYHKEDRREVWFVYPTLYRDASTAPSRVFIYNYEQGSISLDDYAEDSLRILENTPDRCLENGDLRLLEASPSAQSPITAVGALPNYTEALEWQNWEGTWQSQLIAWNDLTGGNAFLTLMALYPEGEVQLVAHGSVYDRDGEAIFSAWETVLHDGGDEQAFKYVDLVQFSLAVNEQQNTRPFRLYIQVGVRANFDSLTVWSTPQWVDCAGNAEYATKKNFKMSGRFVGLRFFSDQADCQWRIASYTISGRLGGTY